MKLNKSMLYAMAIGDGYVFSFKDKRNDSITSGIKITHSIKQRELIELKRDLLVESFGGIVNIHEIDNNGFPGLTLSKNNNVFRQIRKNLYKNNQKVISREILNMFGPKALAIWYMDDGGLGVKYRNNKIHAFDLIINTHISKEENQVIIDYFKEVWYVQFTQCKNKNQYRLRCGTKEARKFIEIVRPYILPSFMYKIDPTLTRPLTLI